ncbi:hypothetical protein [Cohnella thailandensis]|uniref:Transmembrane protein n=1 Tax=Cohnella thailandensis TaxID=557557 RepID=A0A841SXQ9_9BACL|nr:hypothetical protein [Cohnella thailandensis]MBB6635709.1 hypothetical protein [Cohnella thailandensis]MBP1976085.1 hypothetical protein [Cohnella thailandensis]
MKRSTLLIGIAIVSVSIFALILLAHIWGHSVHEAAGHRQSWHDFARQAQQRYPQFLESSNSEATGANSTWLGLLRLAVLTGGALLFLKAGGLLRWIGAVFAALGTWSLLGPVWGSLVLIAVFLFYKRMNTNSPYTAPQAAGVYSSQPDVHVSRGQFLDEWERRQHKEE